MQQRGVSLVEMTVVLGLIGILLAVATLGFKAYARSFRTESQTRLLYGELMKARINAVYQKRETLVLLYPGRFEVYSSALGARDGVSPLLVHPLYFPVTCNGDGDPVDGYPLRFDSKGLPGNWCSICVEGEGGEGAVDSVVISPNMLRIGKRDKGYGCESAHVKTR